MMTYVRQRGTSVGTPCTQCGARSSAVIDSRPQDDGAVRRRRLCSCGFRYTTWESTDDPKDRGLTVTQKKILKGLHSTLSVLVRQLVR